MDKIGRASAAYERYKELRDPILETDARMQIVQMIRNSYRDISFGRYPQTKEGMPLPIEWIVLQRDSSSMTLISRYCLDLHPYSKEKKADWSNADLRYWLNHEFLQAAFTDVETDFLKPVTIVTELKKFGSSRSVETQDKVLLLSDSEARKSSRFFLSAVTTDYVNSRAETLNVNNPNLWWLLTKNGNAKSTPIVSKEGAVLEDHVLDVRRYAAVRPVIVLDFPSLKN